MRIISGKYRGIRLASVGAGDPGAHLRPTTDRVRESLFNVLNNHLYFDDLVVLDLFAGTGALGLEALSRGAAHCTFVDSGRAAQRILNDNIRLTKSKDQTTVLKCPADKLPPGHACDLIFMDPPYGQNLGTAALQSATDQGWIADDATLVWEDSSPQDALGWAVQSQRNFGATCVSFLDRLAD